ncbi:hypothetical protein Rs2_21366 [Raphanus sativus]|nr:hypothetical protein Rs2_21366 [Raphanus sativus]
MDVSMEKTSEDSRENTAGTEPSDVAVETSPTTVNKGPASPSPPAPPATPAIGTHSGEEENEKTPYSGDEENQKTDSEEEQKSDGENEENEGSEEGNGDGEKKDDENEGSEEGNGDGEEEGKDDENEGSEEENRDGEELANGDREANENENPPEPESGAFTEHPQFKHIFHMKSENNHRVQGMWMLLLRTAGSKRRRERWFIVNGVAIRYRLREHGLISGLFCHNYPLGYKELGGTRFVDRHFKEGEPRRLEDVKKRLVNMGPHKDRLKMEVLFFLASVVCAQTKVGHKANDVLEVFQRAVDDLDYCKSFPCGRFSYDYMLKEISHTMEHFGEVVKEKTLWPLLGFFVLLEFLAFEAIPKLGVAFRQPVDEASPNYPRMCKTSFKRNGSTGVSLAVINKELGNTTISLPVN